MFFESEINSVVSAITKQQISLVSLSNQLVKLEALANVRSYIVDLREVFQKRYQFE